MRQIIPQAALGLTLALLLSGCDQGTRSAGDGNRQPKLAYLTNNVSDFWNIARKGVNKAEKELGISVKFSMPPNGTVDEQTRFLEGFIAQQYDAVAISPKDADNMVDLLNRVSKQLKLICVDSDAPKSDRIAYVGTDNYGAGRTAGEQIVKLLPNGGKIAVFVGTLDAQNAQDRYRGIKDVLKENGDKITEVGAPQLDETDRAKAKANVENVITTSPDVNLLVGLWSYNGPAIASAVEKAGKAGQIKVVCFDEEQETLLAVENGIIDATIVQDPFGFSYAAVKLMYDLVTKGDEAEPADGKLFIKERVITRENVKEFSANLAELKKG